MKDNNNMQKNFEEAGFTAKQAKALTKNIKHEHDTSQLVTKDQFLSVQVAIATIQASQNNMATKTDVANVEIKIEKESKSIRMWMVGMFIALAGLILRATGKL